MQTLRLTIALLFALPVFITAHAQDPLDSPVPDKKFSNELLKNVLEELSRNGQYTFSYKSDIIKKGDKVTLTVKSSTLRQALTDILGDGYDYVLVDNYVVIRRRKGYDSIPVAAKRERIKAKMVKDQQEKQKAQDDEARAMVDKERAKADEMKAKADEERVKVDEERAKTDEKRMKVNDERAKMDERMAKRDEERTNAAKATMHAIIDNIVREHIVDNQDKVISFALDGDQFFVNGQSMPDSMRTAFAARYIKPGGSGYYYGPVNVIGHGFFMTKDDLFGH